jgi:hypothetical protein
MRPKPRKQKDSFRQTKRIASHREPQVIEIIDGAESVISRNHLFSMAWPSFCFAIFVACAFPIQNFDPARERPTSNVPASGAFFSSSD